MTKLTEQQRRAVDTRDVSVALSAGAGCGKTHVLTERFLAHLQPPEDGAEGLQLSQLVAITFTDAAAREMRSRIRSACFDRLVAAQSPRDQKYWLRLWREIDSARISTIHAFCTSLLRANAAAAGLDPTFAVLDQGEADLLQFEAIDDVLREQLASLGPETLELAAECGLGRLKTQIASLMSGRQSASFDDWLDESPAGLVDRWKLFHAEKAFPLAVRQIASEAPLGEVLRLLHGCDVRGMKPEFVAARAALLELLPRVNDGTATPADLQSIREFAQVKGICNAKDWGSAEVYDAYLKACKAIRDAIDSRSPRAFDRTAAEPSARLGLALLRLSAKVHDVYNARKLGRGALDFDDLLSAAVRLLNDPQHQELRDKLSAHLRLLLVDEFQDTDQLQVDLVRALCGSGFDTGRLFFVGDFKQSIYRFRGAEPQVFDNLRAAIPHAGRLPLSENFRSQPAILHFVNALFCDEFSTNGNSYEPLAPVRDQATELPAVEFLWTIAEDKNNNRAAGAALEARRKEARAIACRLREMLEKSSKERPVVDKATGQPRRLQLGDIAILFRSLSDVQVYEEQLREFELDYYLVGGHAFFAQQEIHDVLNLLRAVASGADEVSLAAVLRSPFFACEDETLFWLVESAGSLNAGLLAEQLPPELAPVEQAKVVAAAATLRRLRSLKDRVPIARLLDTALDRTGYDAVLLTEYLGQRKLANLNKLIERARAADRAAIDLDGFITQLGQFIVRDPKEALAATLPAAANVIRLMTIHHAKGLEFPLVVVPDLDRKPNLTSPAAVLHPELGPLLSVTVDDHPKNAVTGMTLFSAVERVEELEERTRTLYVAATRAADYLIFSSSLAAFDRPVSDWMKLLAGRFDLQSGQLIAEPSSNAAPAAVRVTTEPRTDFRPAGKSRGADLLKLLDQAHERAAAGEGLVPPAASQVPVDNAARRVLSVSRLTGQLVKPERPFFVRDLESTDQQPQETDRRGYGSLVHDVLSRIDFHSGADVAAWCEHLAAEYVLQNADAAAKSAHEMIARFVASPAGRRLAESQTVHREVEFLLAWPRDEDHPIDTFVRGYIDCLFRDREGNWHLVDYKTDDIAPVDVARAAKRYELQLYVYAMAAERALGRPVELSLHFLRPGAVHVFPWNDAIRARAIALVNESIQRLNQNHEDQT